MEKTYTQADFDKLPYNVREGVLNFYESGYDYSDDSDVWDGREDDEYCTLADLKKGCQIYDFLQKKGEQTMKRISIDNGIHFVEPEEAVASKPWEVIVGPMDDEAREAAHMETLFDEDTTETRVAFLKKYLELAPADLIIG